MRAGGIGLVGLLITFAIIMYLMGGKGCTGQSYLQTMMNVKKEKEPWAQQVGGKDVRGRPFSESLTASRPSADSAASTTWSPMRGWSPQW